MAPLLNAESLSKSFGSRTLFRHVSLHLFQGEKIGLIGPNGSGKSTLLKILATIEEPDEGSVTLQRGLKVGYVPQMTHYPDSSTPEQVLLETLSKEEYLDKYERETATKIILGKIGFNDITLPIATLSGGWKKRLDIANTLVKNPDILLLDEPTNHLDIETILWLEHFLLRAHFTFLLTSHDRNFLESVTQKVIELNPCYPNGSFSVKGPYSSFLEKREEFLLGQQEYQKSLASKVRREIEWLRQTPQARTTKSRSRIQEANRLIGELSEVKNRNLSRKTEISFDSTGRETKKLLSAKNLTITLGGKTLFEKLSLTLTPGMRVAIVGQNGTGKSTLMKILFGELKPDSGSVKPADNLQMVYFDQLREELPEDISVKEALAPHGSSVNYRGKTIHVNAWGKRFLFTPERLETSVKQLSGGEKARILIARLMSKAADILFLDEPTNDLDITTLEILEESLREFPGAIVFITHDRFMLNDLANLFIGLGRSTKDYFFADYYQWENQLKKEEESNTPAKKEKKTKSREGKKLSYKEKKELENMESSILEAEGKVEAAEKFLETPSLAGDGEKLQKACEELKAAQDSLEALYKRWEELENRTKE